MKEITNKDGELDVRLLIPIQRHELLLKLFNELPVGESFVFINDHDPLPLFYEFKSIHGDVVGWEYLNRGGIDWKVKATRTETSVGRDFSEISTLMDLRKIDKNDWKHVVFHRYSMMKEGDVMEIIAESEPTEIHNTFNDKFSDKHTWTYKKQTPTEVVIHIQKKHQESKVDAGYVITKEFDARPFHPAERHEMVFTAFDELFPGEAFIFINDHDPKPLYYQIEAESKEPFTWEYLEDGPDAWKVKVAKVKV